MVEVEINWETIIIEMLALSNFNWLPDYFWGETLSYLFTKFPSDLCWVHTISQNCAKYKIMMFTGGDFQGGRIHSQGFLDQAEDPGIGHFLDVPILLLRCTHCTHWQWSAVIWVLFCCCGRMWSLKLLCWPFLRRNFIIKMVNSHSFTLFFRGHQS